MEFLGNLLKFLDIEMETPALYGWYHLMWLAICVAAGVALCLFKPKPDEKFARRLLLTFALLSLFGEIYKQINYTFSYDGTNITADYQWYAFPFQFCSTPMYVGLLAALIKNRKIHNALVTYLGTYALFAGLVVMIYPGDVFIETIGINIQTMICHGTMLVGGIWLLGSGYVPRKPAVVLKAVPVFVSLVAVATVLNEIAYTAGILETETFNMFFISPHCEPSLAVYSSVQAAVAYPWCMIIYVVMFSVAAELMVLCSIGVAKLLGLRRKLTPVK